MKNHLFKKLIWLIAIAGLCQTTTAQTEFWFEDFGTGCNQGQLANNFTSSNGAWSVVNTGTNSTNANNFFISATEQIGTSGCGTGCGGENNRTLHVSNIALLGGLIPADGGAQYYAGSTFLPAATNRRVESPVIDGTDFSDVSISFDYIEFGDGSLDNATLWYFDGSVWAQLDDMPKTSCCGGPCNSVNQGSFTNYSIALPASADNNPNIRIGFNWVNNNDGAGTDPSFAVDNISISGTFGQLEEVDPPANNDCANAQIVPVTTYPEMQWVMGSLYGATDSGLGACAGSAAGGDIYYTFTTTQENHVIVTANPVSDIDIVMEVLDACNGTLIECVNNGTTGVTETEMLLNLPAGSYIIRIHNGSGISEGETTGNVLVNVRQFPFAQVQSNPANFLYACNTDNRQLEDLVGASPQSGQLPGVLDYQWQVFPENAGPGSGFTYTRGAPNYAVILSWLGLQYGVKYNVYVRLLMDIPGFPPTWGVFPVNSGFEADPSLEGASVCTIEMSSAITLTELRDNYSPTNIQNSDYAMCDIAVAYTVANAENYEWEFSDGVDPPVIYVRGAGNPGVKLSWVECLKPNNLYQVRVRANVDGQWGEYGNPKPLSTLLTANTAVRPNLCGTTRNLNQFILPGNICIADGFEFELTNIDDVSQIHTIFSVGTLGAGFLNTAIPTLVPGATYSVRVKATQCGVEGDFSTACNVTIAGPQAQGDETPQLRTMAENSATLYPNPNAGSEVRVELDGLGDGNHEVMIQIYDIYGKLIQSEGFGHTGSTMSRLMRFDGNMAMGMYMVQVVVDGERFATDRLVVK